jgi:hypothetical protein
VADQESAKREAFYLGVQDVAGLGGRSTDAPMARRRLVGRGNSLPQDD